MALQSCRTAATALAEAFFILAPSFLDIDELPPRLYASAQPIVEVDPSMVRRVQGTELKSLSDRRSSIPFSSLINSTMLFMEISQERFFPSSVG